MKYPFTNATIASRRKGKEALAPSPQNHPARETIIVNPESALPVKVAKKAPEVPKEDPMEKMRQEVARMMMEKSKAKKEVPRSRILSMSHPQAVPAADLKEYADVLAMLLGKK